MAIKHKKTKKDGPATSVHGDAGRQTIGTDQTVSTGAAAVSGDAGQQTKPTALQATPERHTSAKKLPNALKLFIASLSFVWRRKRSFVGIVVIYLLLNLLFVRGLGTGADLAEFKDILLDAAGSNQLISGLTLFTVLLTSGGEGQAAGAYQAFIFILTSLATIWALRTLWSHPKIRTRDTFYKGMYPLVPFILVLALIGLELAPLLVGGGVYSLIVSTGAATAVEFIIATIVFFGLGLLSLYLLAVSTVALYVVALPDMTPLKALRSAKGLIKGYRWNIMRKIVVLPLALLLIGAVIMLPFLLYATVLAPWVFFVLSAIGIVVGHTYFYTLYRELLP